LTGPFRELDDLQMDRLEDEELIGHLVRAREAGHHEQATLALRMFVYRYEPQIFGRVAGKVPDHEVEQVVSTVFKSIFDQVFDGEREPWSGESVASCRAWTFKIVARRIADFYKKPTLRTAPLPEEHHEAEEIFGPDAATSPDATGAVEIEQIVEARMRELSPPHRHVVELAIFGDLPSNEVAEETNGKYPDLDPPMNATNVDQIKSRFRASLKGDLGEDD
jgi:DNA-directed RNA polymerase specialized sigma24 family protein